MIRKHLGQTIVLHPAHRLKSADYNDPRIQESLQIFERALSEIKAFCAENGYPLHIAIMPVREHVFDAIITDKLGETERMAMERLSESLLHIEKAVLQNLDEAEIEHTNLRPAMEAALRTQALYPSTDGHPLAAGYKVAADMLAVVVN